MMAPKRLCRVKQFSEFYFLKMGKASMYLDADGKDPKGRKEIIDTFQSPEWLKTGALEGWCAEKVHVQETLSGWVKLRRSVKTCIFSVK